MIYGPWTIKLQNEKYTFGYFNKTPVDYNFNSNKYMVDVLYTLSKFSFLNILFVAYINELFQFSDSPCDIPF